MEAVNETFERHTKALDSAEEEFYSLSKLNHSNIIAYQGIKIALDHTDLVIQVRHLCLYFLIELKVLRKNKLVFSNSFLSVILRFWRILLKDQICLAH